MNTTLNYAKALKMLITKLDIRKGNNKNQYRYIR